MISFFVLNGFSLRAHASGPQGAHIFVGAGNNFVFPGTIRFGWNKWEFGRLNSNMIGASKLMFFRQSYYTSFGFGLAGNGQAYPAFTAAIGFLYDIFWGLGFRGELDATANVDGLVHENACIGLSYDF